MTTKHISVEERRARLGVRHRLAPGTATDRIETIADDLVGLHSSDPATVYLSLAARMPDPSIAAIESALYDERRLVRHHAMRRTLWVMTPATTALAHGAATRKVARQERARFEKMLATNEQITDPSLWIDEARERVMAHLHTVGRVSTRSIGEAFPELRVGIEFPAVGGVVVQPAHTRLMLLLGMEGRIVRGRPTGSWINGQYDWAPMDTMIGAGLPELDEVGAATSLARQWLRAFGPAPASDLQWWMGWTKTLTARVLADSGACEVTLADGSSAWVDADDLEPIATPDPWVALLPGLDPTIMGWKQRDWYLDPADVPLMFDRNGNGGPSIFVDGRVVGGWVQAPDGEIRRRLFADIGREATEAVDRAAERLESLLGPSRFTVRFPVPLQKQLLG